VIHLGDFDYEDDPQAWDAQISETLGESFPYFAVVGNHDLKRWDGYQHLLEERLRRVPGARCEGEYGVKAACAYQGLFFLLSGAGTLGKGHADFIRAQLAADGSIWRICAWHKNQTRMQLGDKPNEVGWDAYEACRKGGAIIATAHEHSYARTKTLANTRTQLVDPLWPRRDVTKVGGGSTFVFVSGLGGKSIRDQDRCRPTTPPYGCNLEWASIYTADQDATYGALFIDFYVDGDAARARGYFKDIEGRVVDSFTVIAQGLDSEP
jgi:hypothetical protein